MKEKERGIQGSYEMKKHEIALTELFTKYNETCGRIFGQFFLRNKGSDDVKKSMEANDFIMGLLNGNIKKEWKLEESDEYKQLLNLVTTINTLTNDRDNEVFKGVVK